MRLNALLAGLHRGSLPPDVHVAIGYGLMRLLVMACLLLATAREEPSRERWFAPEGLSMILVTDSRYEADPTSPLVLTTSSPSFSSITSLSPL